MEVTEFLPEFEANLERLLKQYAYLEQENARLRQANENQRNEILRTHSELEVRNRQYKTLQTAYAITVSSEDKKQAKQKLTHLIRLVETALEELKK